MAARKRKEKEPISIEGVDLKVLEYFGQIFGKRVELALHDFATGEILWMSGNLTGRNVGDVNDPALLEKFLDQARKNHSDSIVGYHSMSAAKLPLRSSIHFISQGEEIRYVLCVNEDLSSFAQMKRLADEMLELSETDRLLTEPDKDTVADSISEIINRVLVSIVPLSIEERSAKLQILRELDARGVLSVRHVVPRICRELKINQSTYYKYLRIIREEQQS
jgi:predicted transcriptional regulator YheO